MTVKDVLKSLIVSPRLLVRCLPARGHRTRTSDVFYLAKSNNRLSRARVLTRKQKRSERLLIEPCRAAVWSLFRMILRNWIVKEEIRSWWSTCRSRLRIRGSQLEDDFCLERITGAWYHILTRFDGMLGL